MNLSRISNTEDFLLASLSTVAVLFFWVGILIMSSQIPAVQDVMGYTESAKTMWIGISLVAVGVAAGLMAHLRVSRLSNDGKWPC